MFPGYRCEILPEMDGEEKEIEGWETRTSPRFPDVAPPPLCLLPRAFSSGKRRRRKKTINVSADNSSRTISTYDSESESLSHSPILSLSNRSTHRIKRAIMTPSDHPGRTYAFCQVIGDRDRERGGKINAREMKRYVNR